MASSGSAPASLTDTRSVNEPTGNNVAQVIIGGDKRHYRLDAENMPAFVGTYSDAESSGELHHFALRR
jgi:hypothetical protein